MADRCFKFGGMGSGVNEDAFAHRSLAFLAAKAGYMSDSDHPSPKHSLLSLLGDAKTFLDKVGSKKGCRLSVTFVRTTQSVEIFFAIWYLGHLLTSTENLRRLSQGNLCSVGFKRSRGRQI